VTKQPENLPIKPMMTNKYERNGYIAMVVGILIFMALFNKCSSQNPTLTTTRTETTNSGNCITKEGHFASTSRATVEKSAEIAASGDAAAFQQLLMSGNALQLTGGKKVFLVDQSLGMIQFRIEGQTESYWAQRNAISCN